MRISDWSSDVCSSDLHEEHAENIRLKRPAELLFRNILNVLVGMLFPGIVDQDVKSAKFTNRLLHRGLATRGLANVTCYGYGLSALCLHAAACLASVVMLSSVMLRCGKDLAGACY